MFQGIDIFTGATKEHVAPSHSNVEAPIVNRKKWTVNYIDEEGYLDLMNDDGEEKSDLKLFDEKYTKDSDRELSQKIQDWYKDEKPMMVVILSACGEEKIVDVEPD